MHLQNLHQWQHDHVFGQDNKRPGESRTLAVIVITAIMMVIEIVAGRLFGSMALLADGLHMASHAAALTITLLAYWFARRHAGSARFSFGTGKINALGGFSSAILLFLFALLMAWESVARLFIPVTIVYNQAILVAFIGLVVNGISVFILGGSGGINHDHHDHHHHEHEHHQHHDHHHDHNLKAAYLHVMADALTSLLAIFALLAAKYMGWIWMDPTMGIVGALLVGRWAIGLLRSTGDVLLDKQATGDIQKEVRQRLEKNGARVVDLHIWTIAPARYSIIVSLVSHNPEPPGYYKSLLPEALGIAHITVEVHPCD